MKKLTDLEKHDGYTNLKTVIRGDQGIYAIRFAAPLAQLCNEYPGEVRLRVAVDDWRDAKSVLQTLSMADALPESEIEISVEGTDADAEQLVMQICSAIESPITTDPSFTTYEHLWDQQ